MSTTKINSFVTVKDSLTGLDIEQSKNVMVTSVNAVEATYSLVKSQAAFQEVSIGDISTLQQVAISVVTRPTTFAGVAVAFSDTLPTVADCIVKDLLVVSGTVSTKLWVKNLDTVEDCMLNVVLAGQ